ncbi:hypothetical protein BJ963_001814 [Leifsonia soli]|uniref:Uncharacterized protein n=1 Tax=Leifsonia soli TaxID=582665 RepID=A0A852T032_9MICO|nr:hypothetical protein [Leifsonia soli]
MGKYVWMVVGYGTAGYGEGFDMGGSGGVGCRIGQTC